MPTTTLRGWTYPTENSDPWYTAFVTFAEAIDAEVSAALAPNICGGRLTLETGVPVSTTDQIGKTSVFYTPFMGNRVALYDGTRWGIHAFTERTLALGTLTSGKNYDVFLYNNAGTLTLELSAAWTTDTARADAHALLDGVIVKSGATTRRYVGTIRTTSTTTTEDSGGGTTTQVGGKRFVWTNHLSTRVPRWLFVKDTADSWTYTSTTVRVANGATAPLNCVEYVTGDAATLIQVSQRGTIYYIKGSGDQAAGSGIGVDSTTVFSGLNQPYYQEGTVDATDGGISGEYRGTPGLGYHRIAWLEKGKGGSGGQCIFTGDSGGTAQAGLYVVYTG